MPEMPPFRALMLVLLAGAAAFPCGAATEPSLAPQISSVFPHGGRLGTTFEVAIGGANLDGAARLEFASPGIEGRILSAGARRITVQIAIAPRAETGSHEFRLFTPSGTALGLFDVGTLPEINEAEPNDRPALAQTIAYPVLINGTADAEDADFFRFQANAGQTLAFDIAAARNGSPLDPVLALLDERGRQIAYCDDYYIEKDAHLEYTFPRAGAYFVRVNASFSRGAPGADYRLAVTDRAYPMFAIPAGARRGKTVAIALRGANLGAIDRVWLDTLDTEVAHAAIVSRSAGELKVSLEVPAELTPGRHRLHFAAGAQEAAQPLPFEVSDFPEITVADSAAQPVLLRAPVVVNSEIGERGGDYLHRFHTYEFDAPEGARYEFHALAWELGLRTDPVLTLFGPDGSKLAFEDDPAPNSFIHYAASHDPDLVYKFAKAGRYRIVVRDAMYRGGPGFIYRLTVRPVEPDFHLDVLRANVTAYVGRKTTLMAQVHRTGGVHVIEPFKHPDSEIENFRIHEIDGWQAPVVVWADGVPPGVTAERVTAEPSNTTFKGNDGEDLFVDGTVVDVPLQVGPDAKPGTYKIHIRAESSFAGRTVERQGCVVRKSRTVKVAAGLQDDLYLTIVKPPSVLVTAPEKLAITKGEPGHLKLSLFYFEPNGGPIVVEARTESPGLNMGHVSVPAGSEELEVPVTAADGAQESVKVIMIARDSASGRVLGESAPVTVQIGK
jgi:hypothetical protein